MTHDFVFCRLPPCCDDTILLDWAWRLQFFITYIFRTEDRDQCLLLLLSQFKENLVNLRDHNMRTLLHIAAYQNASACFQVLLNKEASVNLKDNHNRTPLMMASFMGHQRIVGMILGYTIIHTRGRSSQAGLESLAWFDKVWSGLKPYSKLSSQGLAWLEFEIKAWEGLIV